MVTAQVQGGAQPLVGVRRWHPDVDHGDVGMVTHHGDDQRVGLDRGGAHLMVAIFEQPGQALPQQGGVLGDDDTHGPDCLSGAQWQPDGDLGGTARWACDVEVTVHGAGPLDESGQALPRIRSAPLSPSSVTAAAGRGPWSAPAGRS